MGYTNIVALAGEETSFMDAVTAGLGNFGTVFANCATVIADNVPMMILLAGGLLVAGFRVFKKAKKAVR